LGGGYTTKDDKSKAAFQWVTPRERLGERPERGDAFREFFRGEGSK
jgi:hypothetical protein